MAHQLLARQRTKSIRFDIITEIWLLAQKFSAIAMLGDSPRPIMGDKDIHGAACALLQEKQTLHIKTAGMVSRFQVCRV
jgi:hypothetical protein